VAEVCDGTSTACPADAFAPSSVKCATAAAGSCEKDAFCTGLSATCPAKEAQAAGVECRAVAGPCDVAEVCDGTSTACPADAFAPSSVKCATAAAGSCEDDGFCSGTAATCPGTAPKGNGAPCGTNGTCQSGACIEPQTCPSGFADCDGDGTCETDLMQSAGHCGRCEIRCAARQVCRGGLCVSAPPPGRGRPAAGATEGISSVGITCEEGLVLCGEICVDTNSDAANCGGCGTRCRGNQICASGICADQDQVPADEGVTDEHSCAEGLTLCGDACADTSIDSANCGACGNRCRGNEVCAGGTCVAQDNRSPSRGQDDEVPIEEVPIEESPVEERGRNDDKSRNRDEPAEEAPVEELPVEEAPIAKAPAVELPVEDAPNPDAPAEEATAEEVPIVEEPIIEVPIEEPAEEKKSKKSKNE
jgi:hypothetical protein